MLKPLAFVLAAVVVAASASASYAQSRNTRVDQVRIGKSATTARAQATPRYTNAVRSNEVYEWGRYQGRDPDPNVRLMLRRDVHN